MCRSSVRQSEAEAGPIIEGSIAPARDGAGADEAALQDDGGLADRWLLAARRHSTGTAQVMRRWGIRWLVLTPRWCRLREEAQLDSQRLNGDSGGLDVDINGMDEATTEHVMRLIEERDVLLRTGLYTSHDQVIAELDKEIKKLMEMSVKN